MVEEQQPVPSPTPEELERSLLGRGHPGFKKGAIKTENYKPEPKESAKEEPKEEEKALEAAKPSAGYRTRAQRPASE